MKFNIKKKKGGVKMIIKASSKEIKIQVEIDIPQLNQNKKDADLVSASLIPVIEKFASLLGGIIYSGEHAQMGIETLNTNLTLTAKTILDAISRSGKEPKTLH